ncbi:hypothetical protein BTA51_22725 [Hahella sp. CCB-MM4]|uniref:esterase/lipase family protein n=1 Tax=Hahella sp. (strain CCB-MM4) TaxID=1926491 RepID=UPI000B9AB181|nr:triacylglycerol lipase [Hahella sp. CCB-MM4]OZG71186.1 hypothetical protein BTA51_22725 [Hahella sp. CCB-MM4]
MKTLTAAVVAWLLALSLTAQAGNSSTRYPIVMVGGATSFDTFDLGLFEIDYWYGITDALRRDGAEVYVTNLSGLQSNEVRGDELIDDVQAILTLTGAEKVNLIAHSQGALASRYVAAVMPDRIASVTTVAGMNRGTHISPWSRSVVEDLGITSGSTAEQLLEVFVGLIFTFGWEGGSAAGTDGDYNSPTRKWQSFLALEAATNPENVELFNQQYPAGLPSENCMLVNGGQRGDVADSSNTVVNGVHYYSIGAKSNADFTTFWEIFDPVYWLITGTLNAAVVPKFDKQYQWDGLVPQCGHKLGDFVGNYYMSHFDAIGHFAGITPSFVKSLYTTQANRLKNADL